MLSGIASYLFGSAVEDSSNVDGDDVNLTTFPMENEWLLVDRAETVPPPAELCPFISHLDESTSLPVELPARRAPAHDVTAELRRSSKTRGTTSRRAVAAADSGSVTMATRRHQQQLASRHASSTVTRKSLQRANRVSEHLSRCSRQRRYNYKLCSSDRQRRSF